MLRQDSEHHGHCHSAADQRPCSRPLCAPSVHSLHTRLSINNNNTVSEHHGHCHSAADQRPCSRPLCAPSVHSLHTRLSINNNNTVSEHHGHCHSAAEQRPKFTGLVWLNAGGIARDHMSFWFRISCLVPEIFAIKVGSCEKSVQILHVFGTPYFLGEGPRIFGPGLSNRSR